MNESEYVKALLAAYVALPDTACRPRCADRALANSLFADGVPLTIVLDALLLAHTRRHLNPASPPEPVRSLHYFLPVIRELSTVDPATLAWLRDSLQRRFSFPNILTQTLPTTGPTT